MQLHYKYLRSETLLCGLSLPNIHLLCTNNAAGLNNVPPTVNWIRNMNHGTVWVGYKLRFVIYLFAQLLFPSNKPAFT